jgi:predicted nucleic acid-binding protein
MNGRVVLADTGPFYALINPRDQYHERARAEVAALTAEHRLMAVTFPTVLETYSLILQRHSPLSAIRWIEDVARSLLVLEPVTSDYHQAIETVRRFTHQSMTLFDAVLASFAIRENLLIWAYDHHFDILGAERWYPGS